MNHRLAIRARFGARLLPALLLVPLWVSILLAERTHLKPGMNFFTPQQDIELGKKVAQDAEKKLPMLNDRRVDDYLQRLGEKLTSKAPGEKYPYQFKGVNDPSINAFALPGGFLFVNRGTIEAADNEAELAGVIGHEIGHVVLRHGTNQASKAELAEAPLAVLGGVIGSNSVGGLLTKLGANFAVGSVLLKYSRDAERQADLMGTQIMFDCNYDPHYLAQFFEKLQTKGQGSDFFSDHPNPDKRIQNIDTEIDRLGRHNGAYVNDSAAFEEIRKYVKSLPPPPKAPAGASSRQTATRQTTDAGKPPLPSRGYLSYDGSGLTIRYPDNWKAMGNTDAFTIAPPQGIVQNGQDSAVGYGVIKAVFAAKERRHSSSDLEDATDQLIDNLRNSNPGMKITREPSPLRIGSEPGLSVMLSNDSPLGGRETDWLVTVLRLEGLVYMVCVAPEKDFEAYQQTFQEMLGSIHWGSGR